MFNSPLISCGPCIAVFAVLCYLVLFLSSFSQFSLAAAYSCVKMTVSFALCVLQTCAIFSSRVTETHQLAELNEKKNERLRAAFGISDSYVDGSSFDPQRRTREAKQPAPEPPKPYRYIRLRNQCQLI